MPCVWLQSRNVMLDKEEKFAVCKNCEARVSWGSTSVKNYNTTNVKNHLRHFHHKLFDEHFNKECDDAKKKQDEE